MSGDLQRTAGDASRARAATHRSDLPSEDAALFRLIVDQSTDYIAVYDGEARLRFTNEASRAPYLVDANARIEKWQRDGSSMQFALNGYTPVRFSLANAGACRVQADGKPVAGHVQGGITRYELKQNGGTISATCAS